MLMLNPYLVSESFFFFLVYSLNVLHAEYTKLPVLVSPPFCLKFLDAYQHLLQPEPEWFYI